VEFRKPFELPDLPMRLNASFQWNLLDQLEL